MDLTGEEVLQIKWSYSPGRAGMYLEDVTTGNTYLFSWRFTRWTMLPPTLQESICRALNRPDWLAALGLAPPE
jgi:hypothetical protein